MSESVLDSVDTGGDLSGAGSGGAETTTEPSQTAGASGAGNSATATGSADSGSVGQPTAGAGADAQSASGSTSQGESKPQLVPLAALQEARHEVKELRTKIAQLEALPRLTEAQQKQLDKLTSQEQAATAALPDFLQDPKGYIDARAQETKEALKKLDEATTKSENDRKAQERAQTEFQQLVGNVSAKEQEFLKTTPDYNDALTHLRTVRASQLALMFPQATAQQIQQQIGMEEIQGARQILQNGGDPAAFAYAYAKTLGYVPKAPAAAGTTTAVAPKVDKDAVRTMGGSGGADSTDDDEGDEMPMFSAALAERFGVKRAKK